MDIMDIKPGTQVILKAHFEGASDFTMEARSAVVNGMVQFKFADMFEWVPVTQIVGIAS